MAEHGPDALATANAQLELSKALIRRGQAAAAVAAAKAALVVFEAHLPDQELPAADALLVLGAGHAVQSDLAAAAGFYRRALGIRERRDPPGAPYLQLLRFNLAATLQQLFDFRGALEVVEAGLRDSKQEPGAEQPVVGNFLSVSALCLESLGSYRQAEQHYLRAEAILRRTRGKQFPDALRMAGLAGISQCRLGRPDEGLPRVAAALLEMREAPQVPPSVVFELEAANAVLQAVYAPGAGAEAALRAAMARLDDPALPDDLRAARRIMLMTMLADFDPSAIDIEAARQALAQFEAFVGPDHEQFAAMLGNFARLLIAREQLPEAEQCLARAMAIFDRSPWFLSTDRWKVLWGAANLCRASGRLEESLAMVRRGLTEMPGLLDAWSSPLDDRQRLEFTAAARAGLDFGLSVGAELHRPAPEQWQLVLSWKGLVSNGMLESLQWLHANRDPESQRQVDALRVAVAHWSGLARAGAAPEVIAAARREREALERSLTQRLGARTHRGSSPAGIAASLATDEVLVDFITYGRMRDVGMRNVQLDERLLAFVVRPGAEPVLVELGALAPITAAVADFLKVGARWTKPIAGADALVGAAAAKVAELVWSPLQPMVPNGAKVVICPESVVAVIPFACLPGRENGTFLLEQHEFSYVASPTDLVARSGALAAAGPQSLLVIGDVDYGNRLAAAGAREGGRDFAPLPGAGQEIDVVATLFPAGSEARSVVLRGEAATPASVVGAVVGANFVHIATHGWFAGSRSLPDVAQRWRQLEASGKSVSADSMAPGAAGGIALAGANASGVDGRDGVLTTDELALLDLSHCELAVLSACETGLGTISAGDGLLGLRRSLRLAGARRSLTSIWRVDDAATLRCMQSFYKELWGKHSQPAAALRAAQLAMLRAARADTGQALVGTWGAFVLESK